MKLFHWNKSKILKNYAHGDLIVMAPNIDMARQLGFIKLQVVIDNENPYLMPFDTEDMAEIQEKYDQAILDLAEEPIVYEDSIAIAIPGSD